MRFGAAIFSGALLSFLIQPLLSNAILPWFGGGPAVWTTCLLFFQVALLAGYAYAHLLVRCLSPQAQTKTHCGLLVLAALTLPILPGPEWKPASGVEPTGAVLALLSVSVGLPFTLLAASSPLLQAWYARVHGVALPYRLYALSNLGSLSALLAYPFLVQPAFDLPGQDALWSGCFLAFSVVCAACARSAARDPAAREAPATSSNPEASPGEPPTPGVRALWVLLAATGSAALMAFSNRLAEDVASSPFLWVLPLALYLLTFVVAFDRPAWYRRSVVAPLAFMAVSATALVLIRLAGAPLAVRLVTHSLGLTMVCFVCHGELARLQPPLSSLTAYYLSISAGGALGGATVALVAPRVFSSYAELPLALLGALVLFLVAWRRDPRGWPQQGHPPRVRVALLLVATTLLPIAFLFRVAHERAFVVGVTARTRNFYGVLSVLETDRGTRLHRRSIQHGMTIHGSQLLAPDLRRVPTCYYGPTSGVGLLLTRAQEVSPSLRVGVIGLGAGTLVAYGRPSDEFTFFEIDPAVVEAARAHFTFLADAVARREVVLGDGRLELERRASAGFDVLALDAFSGDAVPTHLLTAEAFAEYRRHLAPGGVIAAHVSSKSVDLYPVLAAYAVERGLHAVLILAPGSADGLVHSSAWCLLSEEASALEPFRARAAERPPKAVRLWTDAYSNLLPLLR